MFPFIYSKSYPIIHMIQFAQIFNEIRHKYIEHYFALSFFLYIVTFLFQLSKINQLTKLV